MDKKWCVACLASQIFVMLRVMCERCACCVKVAVNTATRCCMHMHCDCSPIAHDLLLHLLASAFAPAAWLLVGALASPRRHGCVKALHRRFGCCRAQWTPRLCDEHIAPCQWSSIEAIITRFILGEITCTQCVLL